MAAPEFTSQADRRRFVVLFHRHPAEGDHYDLMIEDGDALATWRVERPPETATRSTPIGCVRIGDHRMAYLDYEGPVSGNRGEVSRHDAGNCVTSSLVDAQVKIVFEGDRLVGEFVLERDGAGDQWRLRCA